MKQIPLTQGKVALVDDNVFDWAKNYKWYTIKIHNLFYTVRKSSRKDDPEGKQYMILLHHCVVGFPLNSLEVDHIDGNGLNNQRSNLRIVTSNQNNQNRKIHRNGQSIGVTWNKNRNKWQAQINGSKNIKRKYLGLFDTEGEASKTYQNALKEI